MKNVKNTVSILVNWIVKVIVSSCDAAIAVFLLHKMNVLDIPILFIFYYGIIIGTFNLLLAALYRALGKYDRTEKKGE